MELSRYNFKKIIRVRVFFFYKQFQHTIFLFFSFSDTVAGSMRGLS